MKQTLKDQTTIISGPPIQQVYLVETSKMVCFYPTLVYNQIELSPRVRARRQNNNK